MNTNQRIQKIKNWISDYCDSMITKPKCLVIGVSGGVDSAVTAGLLSRAIGKQLKCIFVDTGLLRKNEYLNVSDYNFSIIQIFIYVFHF